MKKNKNLYKGQKLEFGNLDQIKYIESNKPENKPLTLKQACLQFREGILNGSDSYLMCMAVCMPLQGYLEFSGTKTKLINKNYGSYNHVWLEMEDGKIIDPTADQLLKPNGIRMPKVYIGELPEFYNNELIFA